MKPAQNPPPGPPEADSADTRTRLLDAAEELFGQHGFSGASLRAITAAAGANIAAVNYHFGNRAALVQEVIARRVGPVNAERLRRLDELEAVGAPTLRDIADAFLAPALHAFRQDASTLCRIMGRIHAERSDEIRRAIFSHFQPVMQRFTAAIGRARPDLPPDEIADRFKFMVGVMAFALMNPAGTPGRDLARMISFVTAGLEAPATAGGSK